MKSLCNVIEKYIADTGTEIWRPVPVKPFNKKYEVSNQGRLKCKSHLTVSHYKSGNTYKNYVPEHFLTPVVPDRKRSKYLWQKRIVWQYNHKQYRFFVHRLVAKAFLANPQHYPIINHIDRNESHNKVSNLEWCTIKYNNNFKDHMWRVATSESSPCILWTKSWKHSFSSIPEATKFLCNSWNISYSENIEQYIGRVCRGEYKHVYGIRAEYANRRKK